MIKTKPEIKNTISKHTEQIEVAFWYDYEDEDIPADLLIVAHYDDQDIVLEELENGKDLELAQYADYQNLKNSHITKYNKWVEWFKSNWRESEIIENHEVIHI